ncbi:glycoside hydrolase family 36 protein [Nocardioides sp. T2.26MG-1]|uniref:glycoside hydrolase family 36 protein n=1 Tax=Nocardioides sp. T2.26MG-1 TaxID=3041166 RepID=UPI0024774DEB|nr:glycoside hydrolase family 36 protein [Nocardioides sp. T2.26MG-1]CAI9403536.1 Alpha-galactosidase [Nocardioides sp. T2.26MG-1]
MSGTLTEVVVDPARARFYAEGWQSWSPTTWAAWGSPQRPAEPWQHTMRFRPGTPLPEDDTIQGEGLLVVDPGTGAPAVRCAVAEATEKVPTLRASLDGDRVRVSSDGAVDVSEHDGPVAALTSFGDAFATAAGAGAPRPAPRVWCSWYRYFEEVTARDVVENLSAFEDAGLVVEVVQIDDGWSAGLGEHLRPAAGFSDLPGLVDRIRSTGRRAGIWLAPFLVGADTALAHEHPDWLVGDAGRNWGQELRGLDLTHPGVREHLATVVRDLVDLGVDYLKLDFLYAGALPGRRREDVSPVAAYRSGLQLLREAAGPGAYLLGCGAPILPSVGLLDAMRVSPDTFHEGGEDGSTGLRGRMSLVARAWQQGRFWVNDPDSLVARPTYSQRERWAETIAMYGGLRSFSDRVAELDPWGLDTTRRLMSDAPAPGPFAAAVVERSLDPASEEPV